MVTRSAAASLALPKPPDPSSQSLPSGRLAIWISAAAGGQGGEQEDTDAKGAIALAQATKRLGQKKNFCCCSCCLLRSSLFQLTAGRDQPVAERHRVLPLQCLAVGAARLGGRREAAALAAGTGSGGRFSEAAAALRGGLGRCALQRCQLDCSRGRGAEA